MVKFFARVGYALAGWRAFFRNDDNGKIQLAIALFVVGAGFQYNLSRLEWVAILVCIGAVPALEMVNHAIEKLCDLVHPGQHATVKLVKDIAAGAVLWAAVIAAITGILIFWPKL